MNNDPVDIDILYPAPKNVKTGDVYRHQMQGWVVWSGSKWRNVGQDTYIEKPKYLDSPLWKALNN